MNYGLQPARNAKCCVVIIITTGWQRKFSADSSTLVYGVQPTVDTLVVFFFYIFTSCRRWRTFMYCTLTADYLSECIFIKNRLNYLRLAHSTFTYTWSKEKKQEKKRNTFWSTTPDNIFMHLSMIVYQLRDFMAYFYFDHTMFSYIDTYKAKPSQAKPTKPIQAKPNRSCSC